MKNKGFTLIEFMIVVAIIGIFAEITISAYQEHACNDDRYYKENMGHCDSVFNRGNAKKPHHITTSGPKKSSYYEDDPQDQSKSVVNLTKTILNGQTFYCDASNKCVSEDKLQGVIK